MKYWLAFLGVFTKTHHCRACIHNVGINSICLLIWLVLINNRLFFSKLAWPAPAYLNAKQAGNRERTAVQNL